eukprot:gene16185-16361_t
MSAPAVTRAVAALEERLGTSVFVRTTRSVRLTEAGARYLEDTRRILHDIEEADGAAAGLHGTPTGTLQVTASVLFGRIYVAPILRTFVDRHPGVMPEALFVDRLVNLVEEGIDVAVRIGPLPDSSLTAVRVGTVRRVVCGTPGYFAAHGRPMHPTELTRHRVVLGANTGGASHWRFREGAGSADVTVMPVATYNSAEPAIDAAMAGWALTRVLSYQVGPQIEAGALETVLDAFEPEPWPIHVVHPQGRRASAKLRAFVDLAVSELRLNRALAVLPGR